ncbi:response regulator transcription factor [Roseateles chitinivorans]|uniref:response regulator transcription factor n=1 Tax=Roseateles chitinivorans TaxID=2917965 RepID=UPI003D67A354
MRILVIDDDPRTAAYLVRALREANRVADLAPDVGTGLAMLADEVYDAVVVARRLPGTDGLAGVTLLRGRGFSLPVIIVGAEDAGDVTDKIRCLRAGCDDYLSHPYAFVELDVRLDGLVARHRDRLPGERLRVGSLSLDLARREAFIGERRIALTPREYLLLQRLARHAGEVVTREALLEAAWAFDFEPPDHLIDRQMARLRQKLGDVSSHEWIEGVRGVGHRLRPDGDGLSPTLT